MSFLILDSKREKKRNFSHVFGEAQDAKTIDLSVDVNRDRRLFARLFFFYASCRMNSIPPLSLCRRLFRPSLLLFSSTLFIRSPFFNIFFVCAPVHWEETDEDKNEDAQRECLNKRGGGDAVRSGEPEQTSTPAVNPCTSVPLRSFFFFPLTFWGFFYPIYALY